MLKKLSHIILSLLLLISTAGVVVSKHYCNGSFVSASVFHEAKSCCGDSDCCHNEDSFYQVDDDFSIVGISEIPFLAELDILGNELAIDILFTFIEEKNQNFNSCKSPPPLTVSEILSLEQVYLL
jgi:hypothetical protein